MAFGLGLAGLLGGVGGLGAGMQDIAQQQYAESQFQRRLAIAQQEQNRLDREEAAREAAQWVPGDQIRALSGMLGVAPPEGTQIPDRLQASVMPAVLNRWGELQKEAQQKRVAMATADALDPRALGPGDPTVGANIQAGMTEPDPVTQRIAQVLRAGGQVTPQDVQMWAALGQRQNTLARNKAIAEEVLLNAPKVADPNATPEPSMASGFNVPIAQMVDPKAKMLATLLQGSDQPPDVDALMKALYPERAAKDQAPMSVAPGHVLVDPRTGAPIYTAPSAERTAPINVPPGNVLYDPVSGTQIFAGPDKPEPNLTTDRQLVQAAEEKFPGDKVRQAQFISDEVAKRTGAVAAARITAESQNRPPSDQEQTAIAAQNNILASLEQLKGFSEKEITAYSGFVKRGLKNIGQAAAGLGLTNADQRYALYQTVMKRLAGTAFGEGGKQLTPFEGSIVFGYTPTGDEANATQVMTKAKMLEAFTRASREARLQLMRTGRGFIDPDQLDTVLKQKMKDAGLPIPEVAPGWNGPRPGPSGDSGGNTISRNSQAYRNAIRGKSEQQLLQETPGLRFVD